MDRRANKSSLPNTAVILNVIDKAVRRAFPRARWRPREIGALAVVASALLWALIILGFVALWENPRGRDRPPVHRVHTAKVGTAAYRHLL